MTWVTVQNNQQQKGWVTVSQPAPVQDVQEDSESWMGKAKRFAGEVVKAAIVRPAISLAEAPLAIATGGKRTFGTVNIPGLGGVESYASEAGRVAGEIVAGEKPLRAILKPIGEGVLDIAGLGIGGQIVKGAVKQGFKQIVKKVAKEGAIYGGTYGGVQAVSEAPSIKEGLKTIATGVALGAVGGVGISVLGKGIAKAIQKSKGLLGVRKVEKALEVGVKPAAIDDAFKTGGTPKVMEVVKQSEKTPTKALDLKPQSPLLSESKRGDYHTLVFSGDGTKTNFIKAENAKPVPNKYGLDLFVSKNKDGLWVVSDAKSGKAFTRTYNTKSGAIEAVDGTVQMAKDRGIDINKTIDESVSKYGVSPQYTKNDVVATALKVREARLKTDGFIAPVEKKLLPTQPILSEAMTSPEVQRIYQIQDEIKNTTGKRFSDFTTNKNGKFEAKENTPAEVKTLINEAEQLRVQHLNNQSNPQIIKIEELKYEPLIKKSGLAVSVKRKAIKDKIIYGFDKRFRELPEYDKIINKEQSAKAADLILNDYERAVKVAMGEERPPSGLLPEDVYVALDIHATETKDSDLLRRLATESSLVGEDTVMGQRIQALSRLNSDSAVGKMIGIAKARKTAFEKSGVKVSSAIKAEKGKLQEIIRKGKKPTRLDWESFVESIKC